MATETKTEKTIYALTDMDIEEVSVVDRAANKRKFLIAKSKVESMTTKKGAPVVEDGNGGHTVSKETPPPPASTPAPTPTPEPAPTPTPEPTIKLSPEKKGEILKRIEVAAARLTAIKALIDEAEEVQGLLEIPEEIVLKFHELLGGISNGEVKKAEDGTTTQSDVVLAKGLPQFSSARLGQIQSAYEALGAVLGSVAKPEPTPEPEPEVTDTTGEVTKAIAKALAPLEEKIAKGFGGIVETVSKHGVAIAKQGETLAALDRGRETPASGSSEGTPVVKNDEPDAGAWPMDMAEPDRHQVTTTKSESRFTR